MAEKRPDWPALYLKHRDAMHRVAAKVLREAGMADQTNDAVQEAMRSLMASPPKRVKSWEAVMVSTAKRRALDLLKSATVRHAGPGLAEEHDQADLTDIADEVSEFVDQQRAWVKARDNLNILDDRHRKVAWDCVALERTRAEVAAELGVTSGRISQIAKSALEQLRDAMSREEAAHD